jgi:isopropylmalate/homocitrate/citramalate synthase
MTLARKIGIVEVGPRDGLQNESTAVPTAVKIEFVRRAVAAGLKRIEVASFVNPKRVPQMADAEAVLQALPRRDGVRYIGLVFFLTKTKMVSRFVPARSRRDRLISGIRSRIRSISFR